MKVFSSFAVLADKEKFRKGEYFYKHIDGDLFDLSMSPYQLERMRMLYLKLEAYDKLPMFPITIELSTATTVFDMCGKMDKEFIPCLEFEECVINLTLKVLDRYTNTWHSKEDKILLVTTFVPLKVDEEKVRAEYSYMQRRYINDVIGKYATEVSADEIINSLMLEV